MLELLKMYNPTLIELAKSSLANFKSSDHVKNTIRETIRDEFQPKVLEFIKNFIKCYNSKAVTYLQFKNTGLTSPAFDSYLDMLDSTEVDEVYLKSAWESITTNEFVRETQEVVEILSNSSDYIKVGATVNFESNDLNILIPSIRLVLERK